MAVELVSQRSVHLTDSCVRPYCDGTTNASLNATELAMIERIDELLQNNKAFVAD